jgi:hypothetical protein
MFGEEILVLRPFKKEDLNFKRFGPLLLPFTMIGTAVTPAMGALGVTGVNATTLGLMTVGMGGQVASQVMAGEAGKAEADAQAKASEYSAKIEKMNARAEELRGRFRRRQSALAGERKMAEMRAKMGGAGIKITGEGAPVEALGEQAQENELETAMYGYEAAVAAGKHRAQAGLDLLQADLYKMKGRNLRLAGYLGAGSSLLTGFGSMGAFE